MRITGSIKKNIQSAGTIIALLFLFGTSVYAKGTRSTSTSTSTTPIRIISGGSAYNDSLGQTWKADTGYSGGSVSTYTNAIANTNDPALYLGERWGSFSYNFTVAAGTYNVTLKFAEEYFKKTGQRVFGVSINGATVLSNFDIAARAGGPNIAIDETFPVNTTGKISIQFIVGSADQPKVDSIQIVSTATTGTAPATAPTITTQPSSKSITAGQTATFSVAATGTGILSYQWSKNGAAVSGATSSSYTTPAETTTDSNSQFTVAVNNSVGSAISNAAILTVNAAAAVAPAIMTQPSSKSITAGQTATFSVAATGTAPMTYQWSKNGAAVSGATSSSYTTPAETMTDNSAKFTVAVGNSAGSATSNAAVLTVTAAAVAPTITTQPSNQTITAGLTATFNVASTGTAPMTYQWSKNGAAVSGATSSSYTTPAEVTSDNNAKFTVVVTNGAGSATSAAAVLTVNAAAAVAPAITTQPSNQTVTAGQTATFSVAATGTAPMTYQWSKNGTAVSGATSSSYTTPAETTTDNSAKFTVAVNNSAGSATSNSATLTVNAGTLILSSSSSSLNFGSVNVSGSSSQNVTLTNTGTSTVTISNVSMTGAGFNASGVSTGLNLNPGQTATLTATFSPSATGSMTGSVAVASNATNSPDKITLSGTGVAVVNHSVSLAWTASTSTVTGYNTYSSTNSGGPYTKLTSSPNSATSYTDNTVQSGLTYYYVVTAVNSANVESSDSTQISATIP